MEHLFVYGTLLSGARDTLGAAMRARLSGEVTRIGSAVAPGRLYDLGDYPGMVEASRNDRSLVTGEVLQLHDVDATFRWLDAYEDVDHANPARGLYRRVPSLALLRDGSAARCWVYVLNAQPDERAGIAGGCWLSHLA